MTPDTLTQKLKETLGTTLRSVLLYGSAAAGDHAGKHSDYNILVVTSEMSLQTLQALAPIASQWDREGNPAPLLFTAERLQQSADVFPIELLDMKECHKILFGEDVLASIDVQTDNLRLEIEHELRGKLIQLRQQFLLTKGKSGRVKTLMIDSLGTFLVLFRAALRLFQEDIPATKMDALHALSTHIEFDATVFEQLDAMKRQKGTNDIDEIQLFGNYLKTIESVVDAVDAYIHK